MIRPVLAFVAVLTAALNLRAGMASVGAVLDEVIADYGAPASLGGVITALPGLMFCIVGLTAVPLARRVGLSPTLAGAAILSTLGLALRPFAPHIALFILSTVAVAGGIALANVLLPAWIKQYGGAHIVAMTTVYSVSLSLSAAAGPLSALVTDTWQGALALWAVSALVQAVVWLVVWGKVGVDKPSGEEAQAGGGAGIYRSPTAVALMFFFGLQSMTAYIQMGWLPTILGTVGVPAETGALGLSLIGLIGALGGLVLPTVISRARTLTPSSCCSVCSRRRATRGSSSPRQPPRSCGALCWVSVAGASRWPLRSCPRGRAPRWARHAWLGLSSPSATSSRRLARFLSASATTRRARSRRSSSR